MMVQIIEKLGKMTTDVNILNQYKIYKLQGANIPYILHIHDGSNN